MPQCTARAKISGAQCRKTVGPGFTVCRMHGGGAPQVKAKAERRVLLAEVAKRMALLRWSDARCRTLIG